MLLSKSKERIAIENEIDNYVRNIEVIVSLSDVFNRFNGESVIAKKLLYSDGNGSITPDLLTEIRENNSGYGILSESKASLPSDQERWHEDYDQLLRYDKEFQGWSSPIQNHDIVFVTESILTRKFFKFVDEKNKKNKYLFTHKLVFIDSTREYKNIVFIILKQVHGDTLSHESLSEFLRDGTKIPLKNILREIDTTKFLDAHPPIVYTMEIIWDFIFSKMVEEDQIKKSITSTINVDINIDDVLKNIRSTFTPLSNPDVVKRSWVKEALDKFVDIGLGVKREYNNGQYEIHFRKPPKGDSTRNWLIDLYLNPNKSKGKKVARRKDKGKNDSHQPNLDQYFNPN